MTRATGVLFDGSAPAEMTAAIARAVRLRGHATVWRAMQRNAMTADFSWRPAMAQYLALFDSLSRHPEATASAAPQAATAGAAAPPRRARQAASFAAPVPL